MDKLNNTTEIHNAHFGTPNILPMDLPLNDEVLEGNSILVQNYVIKNLGDGNMELIFCNNDDINETQEKQIININSLQLQREPFKMELDLDTTEKSKNFEARAVEMPVIRSNLNVKDSVIQHGSTVTPKSTPATKARLTHVPINGQPERVLVNVTIYSCFKCNEQFNSLTLFRQHLKWHKAEKNYNCTKCPAGFNAENNLKIHTVTSHPGHHTDVCPVCKIKFQRKASLKSHIMIHQVEEFFTCDECHAEFQNDDELLKHMEIHAVTRVTKSLSNSLVCPYCKLDYKTLAEYKQHIEKHVEVKKKVLKGKRVRKKRIREKAGSFKCKYCEKVFSKGCLLDRHERIHTGERPYVCPFCNRAFAQKGTLQIHMGSHTGVKPYSCTLCQARFTQKGNLRAHIDKTHTAPKGNQRIYKCFQCPCIFRKVASLNGHITKVHVGQMEKGGATEGDNFTDRVMDSLKMLNAELGKAGLKKEKPDRQPASSSSPSTHPIAADDLGCVKVAESHASGGVRRYVVRHKKIGDVRWYFCTYCLGRFKKPSDLIRHFRTHTLEKPYKCNKCHQAFSLKSTLVNHRKVHEEARACHCALCEGKRRARARRDGLAPRYACALCDKEFRTLVEGLRHREEHGGEAEWTRDVIGPILKQPLYETTYGSLPLKPPKAKIPNTGTECPLERPHHCKQCDARFTRLVSLKRHMLYHTGDRKFKCTLCPKAFVTKYKLKEHTIYHENVKNYKCNCGKKFVTSSLLKRHMLVHNSFKPYLCPYCGKHFKTLLLSRSHIETVHRLNVFESSEEDLLNTRLKSESATKTILKSNVASIDSPVNRQDQTPPLKNPSPAQNTEQLSSDLNPTTQQQNSVLLSVSPHENQQDTNPAYQMVYLNIADLPAGHVEGVLNGNNLLSSLKIENDSLLFNSLNDLQDSTVLFNIDKPPDTVDPNEVIKLTATSYASRNSPDFGKQDEPATRHRFEKEARRGNVAEKEQALPDLPNLTDVGDLATGQDDSISLQDFSEVDLAGLPISIIGAEDATALSSNLAPDEMNMNPNDMFGDPQVFCVNCHSMFLDMSVFQNHTCSNEPGRKNVSGNLSKPHNSIQNTPRPSGSLHSTVAAATNKQPSIDSPVDAPLPRSLDSSSSSSKGGSLDTERMKQFRYKKSLLKDLERLEQPSRPRQLRCTQCAYSTTLEESFRKHIRFVHTVAMEKVCKYCFKDFKKHSDLLRHLRTHTGERPYECEKCHKRFSLKSTMESHCRTHDVGLASKISCDVCNSNFTTKSSLKVHMLLHTGARPHTCHFCDQTFRTSASRKAHENNTHLNKSKAAAAAANKPKTGHKLLKDLAENLVGGNQEENDVDDVRPLKETESSIIQIPDTIILNSTHHHHPGHVTVDPVFLLQHLQNPDGGGGGGIIFTTAGGGGAVPTINLDDIAMLDYDNLKVGADGNVNVNLITTTDVNMEESVVAGGVDVITDDGGGGGGGRAETSSKGGTKQKRQRVVEKVECDICHKWYASKDVLRKHKKNVHGQNKKFPCIKCDKGYDSLDELNKHIVKLHTGHRPYACQYCENSFSEENSLKTHIKRIHQKSQIAQETTTALLGLQFDLPMVPANTPLL